MLKNKIMPLLLTLGVMLFTSTTVISNDYRGSLRAGVILADIEGNNSVHQPTYNLYDGVSLSLEKFRYSWDNGLRFNANLKNTTRDNRDMTIGFYKQGHGGVNVRHNNYRRNYNFDGSEYTRRKVTSGSIWVKPIEQIKFFGGYGRTDKRGKILNILDYTSELPGTEIDYVHTYFNTGLEVRHKQSYGQIDYNVSNYSNDAIRKRDRNTQRLRISAYTPIPNYDNIIVGGGYQFYKNEMDKQNDTLKANTVWGVARYAHIKGYEVRYNIFFDRTRRTGDLTSTDNIKQIIQAGKSWRSHGGIMLGYGHYINDDLQRERTGNEYSLSGWWKAVTALTLRGGIGIIQNKVDSGHSLTGDREYSKQWLSAKYKFDDSFIRIKISNRKKENEDIKTSADFVRLTSDISLSNKKYGNLYASLTYGSGQYENTEGLFDFNEYTISGDLMTPENRKYQGGIGGNYYRAKEDLDLEISTLRFTGKVRIFEKTLIHVVYSIHNYDDLIYSSQPYTEYYTANIFEVNLIWEL